MEIYCSIFVLYQIGCKIMEEPEKLEQYRSPQYENLSNFFFEPKIEQLKNLVGQYFPIYNIRWNEKTVAFYITFNTDVLEQKFEELREILKTKGYIPRLAQEMGQNIIYIIHSPRVKKRSIWLNIILIIVTLFTTTWAGSILWLSRIDASSDSLNIIEPLLIPECVVFGFLSFAFPLMIILGTHETAHYLAAKKHNIDASLPYFIPLPPPFVLGTMGAFISMREPISNKKALLDIGAAGPIAGFIATIPILIIGFTLEAMYPVELTELSGDIFVFNEPLLFSAIRIFFPTDENTLMHPTAFAGWVGLFVTALNLIPGGQLDGGHIARALLGDKAKYLSYIVIFSLFILTLITGFYLWLFFALIIIVLGTSHPPPLNDISPLGQKRRVIGAFCMVMLLLCIHYSPITELQVAEYDLEFICENPNQVVVPGEEVEYRIKVINDGDDEGIVQIEPVIISVMNSNETDWNSTLSVVDSNSMEISNIEKFELPQNDYFWLELSVKCSDAAKYQATIEHKFNITIKNFEKITENFSVITRVGTFDLTIVKQHQKNEFNRVKTYKLVVENLIQDNNTIDLKYNVTSPELNSDWYLEFLPNSITLGFTSDSARYGTVYFVVDIPLKDQLDNIIIIEIRGISRMDNRSIDIEHVIIDIG